MSLDTVVAASAHGKVNLHLGVGALREDGYHDLVTVFQSLDVADTVTLSPTGAVASTDAPVAEMTVSQSVVGEVPTDETNLAWRAVAGVGWLYRRRHGERRLPAVRIDIDKHIPIAGGMAGGSADAAAALVAADAWFARYYETTTLPAEELVEIAKLLGADVPFVLSGGTAVGSGRGDELVPMLSRGKYHWAMITSREGLSTPTVFRKLDELRAARPEALAPQLDPAAVGEALMSADPQSLARALHNDLQAAALSLRPDLRRVLEVGIDEGALAGIVSGSGPTCALLCEDADTARQVGAEVVTQLPGTKALAVSGPAGPAQLVTD
ncbi:4-(cytidine 5'-diphospho)-2-C-methyl-D-erythritol kinase [Corynebacterium uterequi]|uniref:4-diphosphocytidyl-2-C-methyl-D-erythritol kinase n=1 Tax=Corynebacterium uterequi TaxID=1072256 RepID=A0A0G3HBQ6_9CORY|nr:4-(cytidine 5'-diphospho)-2-C-methyl-D-erythritol kinase [Corynebacterium uterequi]AKK10719.1 4-diphosphocytidyl-2-C-methyl-D-erythritol kinase [Corynebacterium uterequi]